MTIRCKTSVKVLLLLCIPLLLGIECFGLREFFGDPEENSPTEPCMEFIPEPSPLALTPVVTPSEPEPQGTPVISDGDVVSPPFPTILPTPESWEPTPTPLITPSMCQALGGSCSSPGDCCSGLSCCTALPCTPGTCCGLTGYPCTSSFQCCSPSGCSMAPLWECY